MEPSRDSVLDFWFFEDGYGGGVLIEGGAGNFCFLINKDELAAVSRAAGLPRNRAAGVRAGTTGFISVGDAAGMMDPFCGKGCGMRWRAECWRREVVANGFRAGRGTIER